MYISSRGGAGRPRRRVQGGDGCAAPPARTAAIRPGFTERSAPGPRSPLDRDEHRREPARQNSPCSPVVNGNAWRANWANGPALARAQAALEPQRRLDRAPQLERGEAVAVGPRHDHRAPHLVAGEVAEHEDARPRCRPAARATSAAPALRRCRRSWRRATSVLRRSRPRNTRASSIRPAVPESCAVAGRSRASRLRHHDDPALGEPDPRARPRSAAPAGPRPCGRPSARSRDRQPGAQQLPAHASGQRGVPVAAGRARRELHRPARVSVAEGARSPENESGGSVVVQRRLAASSSENAATTNASSDRQQGGPVDARVEHRPGSECDSPQVHCGPLYPRS